MVFYGVFAVVIGSIIFKKHQDKNNGIKVKIKLIPQKRHFDNGKIYFGIYTFVNKLKLKTTEVIPLFVASLK